MQWHGLISRALYWVILFIWYSGKDNYKNKINQCLLIGWGHEKRDFTKNWQEGIVLCLDCGVGYPTACVCQKFVNLIRKGEFYDMQI